MNSEQIPMIQINFVEYNKKYRIYQCFKKCLLFKVDINNMFFKNELFEAKVGKTMHQYF